MAEASLFVLDLPKAKHVANTQSMLSHINVGSGTNISIFDLAQLVARITGFEGRISTDTSKPDGTHRKLMNVSRLDNIGWLASISLEDGIAGTYRWFLDHSYSVRS